MMGIALVVIVLNFILGKSVEKKTSRIMNSVADELKGLADGSLNLEIEKGASDRKDELGSIASSVEYINDKLVNIIKTTQSISENLHKAGSDLNNSAATL